MSKHGTYQKIIENIFFSHYTEGMENFLFEREEIELAAQRLGLDRPKNLGDVIYTFRFRRDLPKAIQEKAPAQKDWVIRLAGDARYRFSATELARIEPSKGRSVTEVPDATPGIIEIHALSDEQALLAKLRYNRLIDIFLSIYLLLTSKSP